jgi:hypothetical protein
VVFSDDIGENHESVSREIDLPEVLRFAQDDRVWRRGQSLEMTGFGGDDRVWRY